MSAVLRARAAPAEGDAATTEPLVSIVVPVYNGASHIRASLDSILAQGYPRLEVIVMDDASTDGTPAVLASYGERIRVIRQPSTLGIYGNANDGIELARGEFIGVFHADDIYLPEMVERQVFYLAEHSEVGAVFCLDAFVDSEGVEFGRLRLPPDVPANVPLDYAAVLNALLTHKNAFLRCPTALVRASIYRELGGYRDELFKNTADLEMWLRIARHHRIAVLEEHLLHYRRGHGSSSERYHRLRTDQERFFTIVDRELAGSARSIATPAAITAYEGHRAYDRMLCARNAYLLGNRELARGHLADVKLSTLRGNSRAGRIRQALGLLALRALVRLPPSGPAVALLRRFA